MVNLMLAIQSTLDDRPEFVVEPKRQNIKLKKGDEKVTLECIAFNALIRWERKSGELPSKAVLREGNSILEIPNPRSEDNGDYRCVAENSFGTSMSKYVKVSIKGKNYPPSDSHSLKARSCSYSGTSM